MLTALHKTPWPWFGGKADAAPAIWEALGDPEHYAEPFAGSLAVLLRRPHPCNRTYFSETVNDLDGLLCNAWRAMRDSPEAMAEAASWPVCEADMHARHLAIVRWRAEFNLERLMADPAWHDPIMAGWWAWGQSCWIGGGWCSGEGGWVVGDDGRITRREKGGDEPGVSRQLPHVSDNGRGVNHAGTREPGVGVEPDYHPMTMPELLRWFRFLSARLRHVRVLHGDWKRLATTGALKTIPVRQGGVCGIFLDPPYDTTERDAHLYTKDAAGLAADVRAWCEANGADPQYRIALAGYDTEHVALKDHGWRCVDWFRKGFLKGGMAQQGTEGHQQGRERLWLSPHCLDVRQGSLFGLGTEKE